MRAHLQGGRAAVDHHAFARRVAGPFLTIRKPPGLDDMMSGGKPAEPPSLYADAKVLAYPVAAQSALPEPKVTGPDGATIDAAALTDDNLEIAIEVKRGSILVGSMRSPKCASTAIRRAPPGMRPTGWTSAATAVGAGGTRHAARRIGGAHGRFARDWSCQNRWAATIRFAIIGRERNLISQFSRSGGALAARNSPVYDR